MGLRGRQPQDSCIHGHDLTKPGAVKIVKRRQYKERQCRACALAANRRWLAKQRTRVA